MRGAIVLLAAALLVSCEKDPPPPPVRPVLSTVVAPRAERTFAFTGSVEPRYRVNLAFRVLGRLVSREVEVGDTVKTNEQVASVEATALELGVRSAIADVSSARAQLANAAGSEGRQRYLSQRNVSSQSQYESAQLSQETAAATERRAVANLAKASEQLTYANLRSEMDGVVTAVSAQVGQVVQAGQSIVTVARPDVREAAVDVPERVARDLSPGTPFEVALQLDPAVHMTGAVREIAPQADQSTRTRRVLISLPRAKEVFRLGTTVTARLTLPANPTVELPRSALLDRNGKTFVWTVQGEPPTVSTREIELSGKDDSTIEVAAGLDPGSRVVIAGVHSLKDGERVRLPSGAAP